RHAQRHPAGRAVRTGVLRLGAVASQTAARVTTTEPLSVPGPAQAEGVLGREGRVPSRPWGCWRVRCVEMELDVPRPAQAEGAFGRKAEFHLGQGVAGESAASRWNSTFPGPGPVSGPGPGHGAVLCYRVMLSSRHWPGCRSPNSQTPIRTRTSLRVGRPTAAVIRLT